MTALKRQNTLFVSENWIRIYEALENVDFRAYDFDNLVSALYGYLRSNYPEEFNDWIASSEFVTKIEILAWLTQNIAFRVDLNSRENFLSTAERRDSLIRLAQNIGYKINRVRSSSGRLKLTNVRTTQSILDNNGNDLRNQVIPWNDPRDEDWFEKMVLILNAAFTTRTPVGQPLNRYLFRGVDTAQYVFDGVVPAAGAFQFSSNVNGVQLPFGIYNAALNSETGVISEKNPASNAAFNLFHATDGRGFASPGTGFFVPFKQGTLSHHDEIFENPISLRVVNLDVSNINNDDFFVQRLDDDDNVLETWTQVDTVFGEGVSFNTLSGTLRNVYELDTLTDDRVRVRFGDGTFGRIPTGRFRFWFRTANPTPAQIRPDAIQNQSITIPYDNGDDRYSLTMNFGLVDTVFNGASSESNADIRTRAGKVFFTQNRMITGQDYNNFFLRDNSILKVKVVNRIHTGQSRYSRLTDPTGLYQNVKHLGTDGRIFRDNVQSTQDVSEATNTSEHIVENFVQPLLRQRDKVTIYHQEYSERVLTGSVNYDWNVDSDVDGQSRGRLGVRNGGLRSVGGSDDGPLRWVNEGAVLRISTEDGPTVTVDNIVEDGSAENGVTLRDVVDDGAIIYSIFPAIRNFLNTAERDEMVANLNSGVNFAVRWDQEALEWKTISANNLDRETEFDLTNAGNVTGANLDASWLVLFEYVDDGGINHWRITDRGRAMCFESANELEFIFASPDTVTDAETGTTARDSVVILSDNESRDSLKRRGFDSISIQRNEYLVYDFVGDGTRRNFFIPAAIASPERTVVTTDGVYQLQGAVGGAGRNYVIAGVSGGYEVRFSSPPSLGANILVHWDGQFRSASPRNYRFEYTRNNVNNFDLGDLVTTPANIAAFRVTGTESNFLVPNLDFGISEESDGDVKIVLRNDLAVGETLLVTALDGITDPIWAVNSFVGDGTRTAWTLVGLNQTLDSVWAMVDNRVLNRDEYSILNNQITFNTPPASSVNIRILSVRNIDRTRAHNYSFTADGAARDFSLGSGVALSSGGDGVVVSVNGIVRDGPAGVNPEWEITGSNTIRFNVGSIPDNDHNVTVWVISGAQGITRGEEDVATVSTPAMATYLQRDYEMTPLGSMTHPDGYINTAGLMVASSETRGIPDYPFLFGDLVLQSHSHDLVLWRKIQRFGFSVWVPIDANSEPRGSYGSSAQDGIRAGTTFNRNTHRAGDIHFSADTGDAGQWLVADGETGNWIDGDNLNYRWKVGRGGMKFIWTHYAVESHRIDPASSNVHNAYILTSGYDRAYRSWLSLGINSDEPVPETSEQLRLQYENFDNFKPVSDSIIYYPARYKPLFGERAEENLRATFKIIQTPGSSVSESDLRLRVIANIEDFFAADRWDFGDSFYFTELVAFIHLRMAPDLQSMVIVPRSGDQAFGRMFQVRSEPDELFVSAALPSDVEVVNGFTDDEIRIGSISA